MDDHKCVEMLNLGIAEKRKGNYEKAINFYEEAKDYNPYNLNIYYNLGKLFCGLGQNDDAIKNFITYAHLLLLNDAQVFNPINQSVISRNSNRFTSAEFSLPPNFVVAPDWTKIFTSNQRLPFLIADENLTFYTGFAYTMGDDALIQHYKIDNMQIEDLKNGLLGNSSNAYLKHSNVEIIMIGFGLVLLVKNIRIESLINDLIPTFYLRSTYSIISPLVKSDNPI